jgi:hypothetical protein
MWSVLTGVGLVLLLYGFAYWLLLHNESYFLVPYPNQPIRIVKLDPAHRFGGEWQKRSSFPPMPWTAQSGPQDGISSIRNNTHPNPSRHQHRLPPEPLRGRLDVATITLP